MVGKFHKPEGVIENERERIIPCFIAGTVKKNDRGMDLMRGANHSMNNKSVERNEFCCNSC